MNRIKINVIFFMSLFSLNFSFQDDKIPWGTKRIEWDDFRVEISLEKKKSNAGIATSIKVDFKKKGNDTLDVYITSFMNRSNSWVKKRDSIGIIHERIHFDITELFARKLRKEVVESSYTKENYFRIINKLYLNYTSKLDIFQDEYDKEITDSTGVNFVKQNYWCSKIEIELNQYKKFESTIQSIKLN